MKKVSRSLKPILQNALVPGKVIVLLGARRTGKTILLKEIESEFEGKSLFLNGEDLSVAELLERRTVENYRQLFSGFQLVVIDEAQKIPKIGAVLKLMADELPELRIMVTGSSAFDLTVQTGEPLTGRKKTFHLFQLSEEEYAETESPFERPEKLKSRLIYGNYPELIQYETGKEKEEYLRELVNSYLLKDILAFENIRLSDKILNLLRLLAHQVGSEVSLEQLGNQLQISKNTVDRYLDLLTKVFVLHKLEGFSQNLRKEITKSSKWYFYDNGILNALLANFSPVHTRPNMGSLWENYVISERIKFQEYQRLASNNYFWRTYDKQEIDWVEEREGKLFGYEFKWNAKKHPKEPASWKKGYPEAQFEVITPENFFSWVISS